MAVGDQQNLESSSVSGSSGGGEDDASLLNSIGGTVDLSTGGTLSSTGDQGTIQSSMGSTGPVMSTSGNTVGTTAGSTNIAIGSTVGSTAAFTPLGENWREVVAKGDKGAMSRLSRYPSQQAALEALAQITEKISRGELRSKLPANATAEQIKAYNAEIGVPETPDKYELTLRDGLVVGETDKPIIDGFLKEAHGVGLTSAQASKAVDWYYDELDRQNAAQEAKDVEYGKEARDALAKEWGNDYRGNMNMITNLLNTAPAGFKDQFLHGRTAEGRPIGSSTDGLRWLAMTARAMNPSGALLPMGNGGTIESIEGRLTEIQKSMGTPAYTGNEKVQQEYRDLLVAYERQAGKGWGT